MLDVVVNHNGWNGAASTVNYRVFHPFDKKEYYHNYCPIVDWSNKTQVEDCWIGDNLVSCPDLYTQHPHVRQEYQLWISDLVRNYSGMALVCNCNQDQDSVSHMFLSSGWLADRHRKGSRK